MTRVSASGIAGLAPPPVTDAEFLSFKRLVYEQAGIHLAATKRALLAARLSRRLRELELGSLTEYRRRLDDDPQEMVVLLDCITTNETRFFREPAQFELLETVILPAWRRAALAGRRPRRVRVWSAGCSSGEEPYSLAMVLLAQLPPEEGWDVEVWATDVSTRVLARARDGVYPAERADGVPPRFRKRFLLRGVRTQAGRIRVDPVLQQVVRFSRFNLIQDAYPQASFDLVLCRNVLIYFDAASKARVLAGLLGCLSPSGLLFLGHAEGLGRTTPATRCVAPNVYAFDGSSS